MIFCFSEATTIFINRCKNLLKEILIEETDLPVRRSSFVLGKYVYPIRLIAFEHPKRLGFFQPDLLEIGINKHLMLYEDETIKEILRHELAHYITYLSFGLVKDHGKEFHSICQKYGWQKEVRATISIETLKAKSHEKTVSKIAKLLELASSQNLFEANNAMRKAKELMLKHKVDYIPDDEEFITKRIMNEKRSSQKMRSISDILRLFYVYPVINHGHRSVYLEILGKEMHVEIAEYIANFLDHTFEKLWKEQSYKGIRAKNSFLAGIAKGFIAKQKEIKEDKRALIALERSLEKAIPLAYPHLSYKVRRSSEDRKAFANGQKAGEKLKIRSPIKSQNSIKLLT